MDNPLLTTMELNLQTSGQRVAAPCILLFVLVLVGCGVSTASSATGTAPAGATPSRFIYGVIGFEPDGDGPQAGQINSGTGAVTPVPGSPFDSGLGQSNILQVVADPQGRFIYTLHQQSSSFGQPIGESGIGVQVIDPATGALMAAANSPVVFPAGQSPTTPLAIDGLGHFLYQGTASGFDVYVIDQNAGALTLTSSSTTAPPLGAILIASPDGRFLFNAGSGMLETLSIDQQTGQLAVVPGSQMPAGGSAGALAIEADGRFLYEAHPLEATVSLFAIASSGLLTPIGTPFSTGASAVRLTLTPDGHFLYGVFGFSTSVVKGFHVDPASSQFMPIQGMAAVPATAIAIDGSGRFAYLSEVQNTDGPYTLGSFNIAAASGVLTRVSSAAQPITDNQDDLVVVP